MFEDRPEIPINSPSASDQITDHNRFQPELHLETGAHPNKIEKLKKKIFSGGWLLLGGLIFSGFVFGIYKSQIRPTPAALLPTPTLIFSPTIIPTPTPTPDPLADWRIYNNPRGYSIKYPAGFVEENCGSELATFFIFAEQKVQSDRCDMNTTEDNFFLAEIEGDKESEIQKLTADFKIIQRQTVVVGGVDGEKLTLELETNLSPMPSKIVEAIFTKEINTYIFRYEVWDESEFSIRMPLFDRMLATFEFLEKEGQPQATISTFNGRCMTGTDKQIGIVEAQSQTVNFSGTIVNLATPCDVLGVSLRQEKNSLEIILVNQRTDEVCIQCLGAVGFSGKITGLAAGDYSVRLIYQTDKEVVLDRKQLLIEGSEGSVEGRFCGGIAANLPENQCPAGYRCQLDGNYPDAGGKCVRE